MSDASFTGPLFIVGMPRSGTKLLRGLLNRHPRLAIPAVESHFVPFFVAEFGPDTVLSHQQVYEFHKEYRRTPFFSHMKDKGEVIGPEQLAEAVPNPTVVDLFEHILKFHAPSDGGQDVIWGDKTPGYIRHIPLLRSLWPEARFLHIFRDPRDYCLSIKRTWGKSLLRAAERWRCYMQQAREDAEELAEDYKELCYDDLLEEPEAVLRGVCEFLECEFRPRMLTLERPAEYFGDARGQVRIVRDNTQKYRRLLSAAQVRRIEQIALPAMRELGIEPEYARRHVPLARWKAGLLKLHDGVQYGLWSVRHRGLIRGPLIFVRSYLRGSWRYADPD